tara:strand:+ start:625 stop:1401 length:777 start_codon:yes stop_codon:yes gene_type:complete
MDGFKLHGLRSLSASQINDYAADPAHWFINKMVGTPFETNAAMERGKAGESGICHGLFNQKATLEECVDIALKQFDEELAFANDPKYDAERKNIPGLVEYGLKELRQYGVPSNQQEKLVIDIPDVPVPFVGYTDLVYADHGIIVDIKTTTRMPSAISEGHARQGAIYANSKSNYSMRFAYIKPKPSRGEDRACNVYEMSAESVSQKINEVREIALRMNRFLCLSKDKEELASLLVPNYEGFRWNNPTDREAGRKIFGF